MANSPPGSTGGDIAAETTTGGVSAQKECVSILNQLELNWSEFRAYLVNTVQSNPQFSGCMLYANHGMVTIPQKARSGTSQNVPAGR